MKYEIKKSSDNQFYFVLKAQNREIIAVSEMYKTKQDCKKGIASIRKFDGFS